MDSQMPLEAGKKEEGFEFAAVSTNMSFETKLFTGVSTRPLVALECSIAHSVRSEAVGGTSQDLQESHLPIVCFVI